MRSGVDEKLRARERAQIRVLDSVLPTSPVCPGGSASPGSTAVSCEAEEGGAGSSNRTCLAGFVSDGGGGCVEEPVDIVEEPVDVTLFDLTAAPHYPSSHTFPVTNATRALVHPKHSKH